MTRFVYVARPIDQAREHPAKASSWGLLAQERLSAAGLGVYAPDRAFTVPEGAKPTRYIERVNRQALAHSSGLLALLPAGVPTIGVPMEIEAAWHQGIPVAVVTDTSSWALVDRPGIELFECDGSAELARSAEGAIQAAVRYLTLADYTMERRRQPLPFKCDDPRFLPTRAHDTDAGFDLYVAETITIEPGQFVDVPLGCSVELPEHTWAMLTGRSSTLRRRGLLVSTGIIDPGYRGPLFAGVQSLDSHTKTVGLGERIAQLILMSNQTRAHVPVAVERELAASSRGVNGFGSSGV